MTFLDGEELSEKILFISAVMNRIVHALISTLARLLIALLKKMEDRGYWGVFSFDSMSENI